MTKNKSKVSAIIVLLILVIATLIFIINNQNNNKNKLEKNNNEMILFYSLSCPHCQNVEKYLQENNIKAKYNFSELEITEKKNSELLLAKAKICGLDTQTLGVPFLWTGEKCLLGDTEIINFFSK